MLNVYRKGQRPYATARFQQCYRANTNKGVPSNNRGKKAANNVTVRLVAVNK